MIRSLFALVPPEVAETRLPIAFPKAPPMARDPSTAGDIFELPRTIQLFLLLESVLAEYPINVFPCPEIRVEPAPAPTAVLLLAFD
jgi:hypothetical protein